MSVHIADSPLRLLKEELESTLRRAQRALESYLDDPDQTAPLATVADHMNQVRGVFAMLEQADAAALTQEIVALTQDLVDQGNLQVAEDNVRDVLLSAVLQLPRYVEWLLRGNGHYSFDLQPLINQVRMARGLTPEVTVPPPASSATVAKRKEAQQQVRKLATQARPQLQRALLGVLRGQTLADNLAHIIDIFAQFKDAAIDESDYHFWWLAEGLASEVKQGNIAPGQQINLLLRDLDRQVKRIMDGDEAAFTDTATQELSQRIIDGMSTSRGGLQRLEQRRDYRPPQVTAGAAATAPAETLLLPDVETLQHIAELLRQTLALVKDNIDLFERDEDRPIGDLQDDVERLHVVANVLKVLNLDVPASLVQQHEAMLQQWLDTHETVTDEQLFTLAKELILVENSLDGVVELVYNREMAPPVAADLDAAGKVRRLMEFEFRRSRARVAQEAIEVIGRARELVVTRLNSSEKINALSDLQAILQRVGNMLAMLECGRVVKLTNRLATVTQRAVADPASGHGELFMSAFAQAMVAIEYYLELLGDSRKLDDEILDHANEQLLVLEQQTGITPPAEEQTKASQPVANDASAADTLAFEVPAAATTKPKSPESAPEEPKPAAPDGLDLLDFELPEPSAAAPAEQADQNDSAAPADGLEALEFALPEPTADVASEQAEVSEDVVADTLEALDFESPEADDDTADTRPNPAPSDDHAEVIEFDASLLTVAGDSEQPVEEPAQAEHHDDSEAVLLTAEELAELGLPEAESTVAESTVAESTVAESTVAESNSGEELEQISEEAASPEQDLEPLTLPELDSANSVTAADEVQPSLSASEPLELDSANSVTAADEVQPSLSASESPELDSASPETAADEVQPVSELLEFAANEQTAAVEETLTAAEAGSTEAKPLEAVEFPEPPAATVGKEAAAPVQPAAPAPSEEADSAIDPEFVEIFFEEAREELATVREQVAIWQENLAERDALTTIRRTFHTLKGSGRMVGQHVVGEFAWCYENLLNRVLDGALAVSPAIPAAVDAAQSVLRPLVEDGAKTGDEDAALAALTAHAEALLRGETPPLPDVVSTAAATVAVSEEPPVATTAEKPVDEAPVAAPEAAPPETAVAADEQIPAAESVAVAPAGETAPPPPPEAAGETAPSPPPEAADETTPPPPPEAAGEVVALHPESADATSSVDQELIDVFQYEAAEILDASDSILERWKADHGDMNLLNDLRREMHTLKGSSRMTGFMNVGDLAHAMENLLDGLSRGELEASATVTGMLQHALDELNNMLAQVRAGVQPVPAADLIADIKNLAAEGAEQIATATPEAPAPSEAAPAEQVTEIDPELVEVFQCEAAEILDNSDGIIQRWNAERDNMDLLNDLRREMHTLKGSSRMTGFATVGNLAHAMESLLDAVAKGTLQVTNPIVDALQGTLDELNGMVTAVRNKSELPPVEQRIQALRALLGEEAPPTQLPPSQPAAAPAAKPQPKPTEQAAAAVAEETIRVSAPLLNNLVNQMGESSIYRARIDEGVGGLRFNLNELNQTVGRLRQQMRRLEIETEAQIRFRYEESPKDHHAEFDPLELDRFSELQQVSRSLMEIVDDLASLQNTLEDQAQDMSFLLDQQGKVNKEIQQGLMQTRMVSFNSVVPRLRRVVRQAAQELGKQAEFTLRGSEAEVDRTVLENMVAPLEHMLRNAVSHGIETPEQRRAAGKPEGGTIILTVSRDGAELVLHLRDDGAGLNYDAIRAKGEANGMLTPGQPVTEQDLIALLLRPGFSTASKVTQISGRGVGMDVLNDAIKSMRGALHIQSKRGQGSDFVIRLPFSLAVTQALLVKAGNDTYAVPLLSIEAVSRLSEQEFKSYRVGEAPQHEYGDQRYPIHSLSIVFNSRGGSSSYDDIADKRPPALLFRSAEASAALHVDAVLGNQEIIVKPVGPQFDAVAGISGATVLGDGRVIVVLELAALVRSLSSQAQQQAEAQALQVARQEPQAERLTAMVIDDSITMRRVTARFLERHGMRVTLAKDGLEAVAFLEEQKPNLVILDIEMPRMDGFEVVAHIRNREYLRHLPVIMVTSRSGEKHRDRAARLGVDDYLIKPYQEEEMINAIRKVLGKHGHELAFA